MIRVRAFAIGTCLFAGACGGPQTATEPSGAPIERDRCVDSMWERPPEDIGENPPSRQAPDSVLAPFDGEGSGP